MTFDGETRAGIAGVYQRHDRAMEKRAAVEASGARVLAMADRRTASPNVMTICGRAKDFNTRSPAPTSPIRERNEND